MSARSVVFVLAPVIVVVMVCAGRASGQELTSTSFRSSSHRLGGGSNTPRYVDGTNADEILTSAGYRTWGNMGQPSATEYDRSASSTKVPNSSHYRSDVGIVPEVHRTIVVTPGSGVTSVSISRKNGAAADNVIAGRAVGASQLQNSVDVFGASTDGTAVNALALYNSSQNAATLIRPGGRTIRNAPLKANTLALTAGAGQASANLSDFIDSVNGLTAGTIPLTIADGGATLEVDRDKTSTLEVRTGLTINVDAGKKLALSSTPDTSPAVTIRRMGSKSAFRGVYALTAWLAYACGDDGEVARFKGGAWNGMKSGISQTLNAVHGTSAGNVYAAGESGKVIKYDGSSWTDISDGAVTTTFTAAYAANTSNIFFVGLGGVIRHYNGSAWSTQTSGTTANLFSVSGTSASDVFAVGDGGVILHYNGTAWSSQTSGTTANLRAVWATLSSAVTKVLAGGDGGVVRKSNDGAAWVDGDAANVITADILGVHGLTDTEAFLVCVGGAVYRGPWNGGTLTWDNPAAETSGVSLRLRAVASTGTSGKAITVGDGGLIVHRNASTTWDSPVTPPAPGTYAINVQNSGSLSLDNFSMKHGKIAVGATPTAVTIDNGAFDRFAAPPAGVDKREYIDLSAYAGSNLTFQNLSFDNFLFTRRMFNIKGPGSGGPVITVQKYSGRLAGDRFDNDANQLVRWVQAVPNVERFDGAATTVYSGISAALAAAGVGDVITIKDNFPYRENISVATNNVTVQGGSITGDVGVSGATGVTIRNMMVNGNIGSGGVSAPANVYHCSANGNITAVTEVKWSIATGTISPNTAQNLDNPTNGVVAAKSGAGAYFVDAAKGDMHLNTALTDVTTNAVDKATTSTETDDVDGAGTRPTQVARDIGADETGSQSYSGRINWRLENLGPVEYMGYEWQQRSLALGCGSKDGGGVADWENSLVIVSETTGAVIAGIRGSGTARTANVGFPNSMTFGGAVSQVRVSNDYLDPGKYVFLVLFDSDGDGLADSIRKITVPTAGGSVTWASAAEDWTFSATEGPLGEFTIAGSRSGTFPAYDIYVVADQDTAVDPSGGPVLFQVNGATGATVATNTTYEWNYKSGVSAWSQDAIFSGLKDSAGTGDDLARFDSLLNVTQSVNLSGATGLDMTPTTPYFGHPTLFVSTSDNVMHARLLSTLGAAAWGAAGDFDLTAPPAGDVVASGSPVLTTPPFANFGHNWVYAGYKKGEVGYLAKVRQSDGNHADTDWTSANANQFSVRGTVLRSMLVNASKREVYAITDNGYLLTLGSNNTTAGLVSDSDGAATHNSPYKVSGGAVRFAWWVYQSQATASVIIAGEEGLLSLSN